MATQKNYGVQISNLSEAELKCLEYTTSSIDSWLNTVVDAQVSFARQAILAGLRDHCFNNGITPAATEDEKIMQAFELGVVKTAAEALEELLAQEAQNQD